MKEVVKFPDKNLGFFNTFSKKLALDFTPETLVSLISLTNLAAAY